MSKKSDLVRGFGLAMSIGAALDEIRREEGLTEEEFHILGTPEGRPHLKQMVAGLKIQTELPKTEPPKPVYLRRLYAEEEIVLDLTNGWRTIARAEEVFRGGIDSDFVDWHLDVTAQPTKAMKVAVYEMFRQDGTFAQIYGSILPLDQRDRLCLTPHQWIDFCVKYKDKLRQDGYGTFFLFKVGEEYFVANVRVNGGGTLSAFADRFSRDRVWRAEDYHRFVLPELEPSENSVSLPSVTPSLGFLPMW